MKRLLFDVSPRGALNDLANSPSAYADAVCNGLVCFSVGRSGAYVADDSFVQFRAMMGRAFGGNNQAAFLGAEPIPLVVVFFDELIAAVFTLLCSLGWLVAVGSKGVHGDVLAMWQKLQVLYAIVRHYSIDVVYVLGWQQWAAKVLAHYQSMLQYISALAGIRVAGARNQNVTIMCGRFSTIPSWVVRLSMLVPTQVANILASIVSPASGLAGNKGLTTTTLAIH